MQVVITTQKLSCKASCKTPFFHNGTLVRYGHLVFSYLPCTLALRCYYFQPLKIVFKKEQDATMARIKLIESNKITFVGWVVKALNWSLAKYNTKVGFKGTRLWPFNPKVIENKTQQTNILHNMEFKWWLGRWKSLLIRWPS